MVVMPPVTGVMRPVTTVASPATAVMVPVTPLLACEVCLWSKIASQCNQTQGRRKKMQASGYTSKQTKKAFVGFVDSFEWITGRYTSQMLTSTNKLKANGCKQIPNMLCMMQ